MHWRPTTVTLVSIFMSVVPRPLGGHQGLEVLSTTYKGDILTGGSGCMACYHSTAPGKC